jgi:sortase A
MFELRRRLLRSLFLLTSIVCLGWVVVAHARMHFAQRGLRQELIDSRSDGSRLDRPGGGHPADGRDPELPLHSGEVVGRIEIPQAGLDVMALEGVRSDLLDKGVGHFPDTSLPGFRGNAAFAGHRDTFFRPLRNVVQGDTVRVTTSWGRYTYAVRAIRVVDPDDVAVLEDQHGEQLLTLISCYPFDWVGPAHRRVVITALPISNPPS